jgi:DNA polymerase-3 subunit gamma/tau
MAYQVLARKYRPQRFSDVIGQDHVTRTLKNAIEQQRIAHGYIFSGHRGIGKTTIARILAMALNCRSMDHPVPEPCGECDSCREVRAGNAVDVIEIDAATNRGIDEIRDLRDAARYRPARDRYKIYILDEAHQITDAAFNALLKTLEEPPGHIIFMMATTQPEDIPQTIRSRCQNFNFHAVRFDDIVGQLRTIAKDEAIQADDEALAVLAEAGDGSMRDALSIMDQAIACCGDTLSADAVLDLVGVVGSEMLENLMDAVARNSGGEALRLLDQAVTEGQNPVHLGRQLVKFLRNAVVAKVSGVDTPVLQISSDERARIGRVTERFSEEDLARFLQIMLRTYGELSYRQEQRFHLELGVLKLVHAQRLLPLEQILSQAGSPLQVPTSSSAQAPKTPVSTTTPTASRPVEARPSAFEADRARKGRPFEPEMSAPVTPAAKIDTKVEVKVEPQGEVKAQVAVEEPESRTVAMQEPEGSDNEGSDNPGMILGRIVNELEQAGHSSAAMMLEKGSVTIQDAELMVSVPEKPVMIGLAFSADLLRKASAIASAAAGRPLKVKVSGGAELNGNAGSAVVRPPSNNGAGARGRAADDPVVQRMQEKFGAEIRTVIDYRSKN